MFMTAQPESDFEQRGGTEYWLETPTKKRKAKDTNAEDLKLQDIGKKKVKGTNERRDHGEKEKQDETERELVKGKKKKKKPITERKAGVARNSNKAQFIPDISVDILSLANTKGQKSISDFYGANKAVLLTSSVYGEVIHVTRRLGEAGALLGSIAISPMTLKMILQLSSRSVDFCNVVSNLSHAAVLDSISHPIAAPEKNIYSLRTTSPSVRLCSSVKKFMLSTIAGPSPTGAIPLSKRQSPVILAFETPSPIPANHAIRSQTPEGHPPSVAPPPPSPPPPPPRREKDNPFSFEEQGSFAISEEDSHPSSHEVGLL
ncbi:hypothetical protein QFC24_006791 [Naganishia onofrii]|uniref:Uncharacterized protein n=1 Tax=Naganishia onofrii TaxID=1851511 RepID=A0ACC2WWZ4_9TREE|nr:hypothetical protein QFC24_006791 [Naganishia onofrii]